MIKYLLILVSALLLPSCTTVVEPVAPVQSTTSVSRETRTTVDPYTGGQRTDTTTTIAR